MEREERDISYFDQLPKETQLIIISFLNLTLKGTLKIQSVSKRWKELAWLCVTDLDTRAIVIEDKNSRGMCMGRLASRLNFGNILKITLDPRDSCLFPELKKCVNLEYYDSIDPPPSNLFDGAKNLAEVTLFDQWTDFTKYNATVPYRVVVKNRLCHLLNTIAHECDLITPKLNYCEMGVGADQELGQQKSIKLNKKFQCGGMIGDDFVVIGASDGELLFLKLDFTNNSLTVHSSNNIHKGLINEIWNEQSRYTYVASSDGIVTSWDRSAHGPEMKQKYIFPEDILFVCETPTDHILAAGKRKFYVADTKSGEIVKQEQVEDDIIGLGNMFNWCGLGTSNRFYTLLYNKFGKKKYEGTLLQVDSVVQTPNFWRSPEGSLRAVAYPHEVLLLENSTTEVVKRCLNRDSFKFDVRRGLLKFNPAQYWMTVSTGTNIITYDLEMPCIITSVSPRISRSEIDAKKFPICNSLWYSRQGDFLFSLFSNDELCWWHYASRHPDRSGAETCITPIEVQDYETTF
jgi:hypothetical protein